MKTRNEPLPVSATPAPSLDQQLRFAIAHTRLLRLTYNGVVRITEPHDYGVHRGTTRLLVYQRSKAGASDQDAIGWRLLDTGKISDCAVLEATFSGTRGRLQQRHYVWEPLYARVG
jgi:hypothetical protein